MTISNIYMDACCFIEVAKGQHGTPEHRRECDVCWQMLKASRDGEIQVYTSTITIAEACHIGDNPPDEKTKAFFERLFLSGRDGVLLVEADPWIMQKARDLSWDHGIGKGAADRIHMASAIIQGCDEALTIDGRLAQRIGHSEFEGVRIVSPLNTTKLPSDYQNAELFDE